MIEDKYHVSIIVPTYHRNADLFQCLDCIARCFSQANRLATDLEIECIVTDDARDLCLANDLRHRYPWVVYTPGPSRGPAANRNHGATIARGSWLLFTDDDCLPQPEWVEAIMHYMQEYELVEGKVTPLGNRSRVDEECPINSSGGKFWSCNLAVNRCSFLQLGGFNEIFPFPAMEDVEFRTRAYKAGLKSKFVAEALVMHPWRRRKGFKFVRQHASSVASFVQIFPEFRSDFTLVQQVVKTLRSIKSTTLFCIKNRTYLGCFRQLGLDIASNYFAWRYVRQSKY